MKSLLENIKLITETITAVFNLLIASAKIYVLIMLLLFGRQTINYIKEKVDKITNISVFNMFK